MWNIPTKIKGCKEYCEFNGRQIVVVWQSPYRFKTFENGEKINLEDVLGCKINLGADNGKGWDGDLPREAHDFCDKYSIKQGLIF